MVWCISISMGISMVYSLPLIWLSFCTHGIAAG